MSMACLANHVGSGLWVDASCSTHSVMRQHGRSMAPALRHHSDCPTHDSGRQTHMRVRGPTRSAPRRGFHWRCRARTLPVSTFLAGLLLLVKLQAQACQQPRRSPLVMLAGR